MRNHKENINMLDYSKDYLFTKKYYEAFCLNALWNDVPVHITVVYSKAILIYILFRVLDFL